MKNREVFFILATSDNGGKSWVEDFSNIYDTGAAAARDANNNNDWARRCNNSSSRWRVRRVANTDSDNFIARELAKDHQWVDWAKLENAECGCYNPKWQLAHIDPDKPKNIRFFTYPEDAVEGKYTSCKMPRFFTNYAEMDIVDCEEYLVELGYYEGEVEYQLLTKAEDIVNAYENGPTSCMNDPDEYPLAEPVHPVSAYASPDFALAVARRGGDITARAVVSPVRKVYRRIYGHDKLLEAWLKGQGYRQTEAWSPWRGLKLVAIEYDDNHYLCPYLDMSQTVRLSRNKQHLVLMGPHGPANAQQCDGLARFGRY